MINKKPVVRNAVRIGDSWESFLNEHPEVQVIEENSKIVGINFSNNDVTNLTFVILDGCVVHLEYCLNGVFIQYTSNLYDDSLYALPIQYYQELFDSKY